MVKKGKTYFYVGIDEVGRGPLAGPVAVCSLYATKRVCRQFADIKESKQLSGKQREEWYKRICQQRGAELGFAVSFIGAKIIDEKGINYAIMAAIERSLRKIPVDPENSAVLLDGGLRAPDCFVKQKTIPRGDATETIIAMASIVAKVLRDRRMVALDKKYPGYGFAEHKGYGTAAHIASIRQNGPLLFHRRSFITRVVR